MPITVKSVKFALQSRECKEERGVSTYPLKWQVIIEEDEYAEVTNGLEVLTAARAFGSGDHVPATGESHPEDSSALLDSISCLMDVDEEDPTIWTIEAMFKTPSSSEEQQNQGGGNPIDWDTEYWIEWVEEEVPLEVATMLSLFGTDLGDHLGRSDIIYGEDDTDPEPEYYRGDLFGSSNPNEPGPIVNMAGQQTVDPLTVMERRPVLCARRNYTYLINCIIINQLYTDSVNGDIFLGDRHRTWRFLSSESEPQQMKMANGLLVPYYTTTVKLEYKPDDGEKKFGWDRLVLNNGQAALRKLYGDGGILEYVKSPFTDKPMLFPAVVRVLNDIERWPVEPIPGDSVSTEQPTASDFGEEPASEPVLLNEDGTQNLDPEAKGIHIRYRHYVETPFNEIPIFAELIQQYEDYIESLPIRMRPSSEAGFGGIASIRSIEGKTNNKKLKALQKKLRKENDKKLKALAWMSDPKNLKKLRQKKAKIKGKK